MALESMAASMQKMQQEVGDRLKALNPPGPEAIAYRAQRAEKLCWMAPISST
jgi:hypothetical protein